MSKQQDEVDEAAVQAALEEAYKRKDDVGVNKYELFAYASELPAGTPDDVALSIAGQVIENPPEMPSETAQRRISGWSKADFSATTPGVYPSEHREHDAWMMYRLVNGRKQAYAPWSDRNAPAPCEKHGITADDCDCDARWKWGWENNRRSFEKAELALDDYRFEGLAYIQTEADPFVFVDGDDVRCPETGDVHPAFVAVLEHLGLTYADVSTSGTGVHAYYRGTLPEDETVAEWGIDDEPFGANDDLPAIELYSGKHVCVTTGEHVDGTPKEVRPWNGEVLRPLLEANGEFTDSVEVDTTNGRSSGKATGRSEHIDAVNALNAVEVAEKTIVDEWTDTAGSRKAFLPTWGNSGDGGTANFVDSTCWVDTGNRGGRGGPIEMALIDLGELSDSQSEVGYASGSEFWTGYEHLRDLGFDLPESPHAGSDDDTVSDYYDADLGAYVDGDPWSDPDAMLTACLMARAEGAVAGDAEPPTLALTPIVREYLGVDRVGEATKQMAAEVYQNELSRSKHVEGGELKL
jgi:hypothetical protein